MQPSVTLNSTPSLSISAIANPLIFLLPTSRFLIPFSAKPSKSLLSTLISPKPYIPKFRPPVIHCCSRYDDSISVDGKLSDDSGGFDDSYRDSDTLLDGGTGSVSGDEVYIGITKTGNNSRRVVARIGIDADLDVIWGILTDYERLADFIPGLAVSQLMEKKQNFARLYQIGEQDLAWGLKFNAKGIVDCFEKELETLPVGRRRDIEFKMIEGDFQVFEGKWSIEQVKGKRGEIDREFQSVLSYVVNVKPKLLLPVQLVEGRLCKEIQTNLICIREEARKTCSVVS